MILKIRRARGEVPAPIFLLAPVAALVPIPTVIDGFITKGRVIRQLVSVRQMARRLVLRRPRLLPSLIIVIRIIHATYWRQSPPQAQVLRRSIPSHSPVASHSLLPPSCL